ncbi:hypothetical protein [Sulfurimonas sp.]|uniref:hypothetical protein n=1 Tax=Sulfurimonas sp. TaxID=2022749 RepID=UPI003D145373
MLWNTLLADSLVLNNVLPQNNSTIKEELYPVGLNNTYFSYITKTYIITEVINRYAPLLECPQKSRQRFNQLIG